MIVHGHTVEACGVGNGRYWIVRPRPNYSIGLVEPRAGDQFAAFRNGVRVGIRSSLDDAVLIIVEAEAREPRR